MPRIAEKVQPGRGDPGRPAGDGSTSAAHLAQGEASHHGGLTRLDPHRRQALGARNRAAAVSQRQASVTIKAIEGGGPAAIRPKA